MNIIIFGGTGEIGGAVVKKLISSNVCTKLTMINRREVKHLKSIEKITQVIMDTKSSNFEEKVKEIAQDHDVAISCLGLGAGFSNMSEEQAMEIEVHLLAKYARACKAAGIESFELLTGVSVKEEYANSKFMVFRIMGEKYKSVLNVGFKKLAVFQPGMIVDNKHTSKLTTFFTQFIPDSFGWGNIYLKEVAGAFVAHLEKNEASQTQAIIKYGNKEMKKLLE
jgi:hypothetical protein